MGDKEFWERALQDHNPHALIGLEFPAEFIEFLRQNFIKKIYRRMVDADECDTRIKTELKTFVIGILQGNGSVLLSQSFCTGLVRMPIFSISTS